MGQLVFQATLGGQVNLVGPNTASTFNINVPTVSGNLVTTGDTGTVTNTMISGPISVANGGTSLATLTANNVILGNGTSAPSFVAPGTAGNILTSNGTTWTSAAAGGGAQATPTSLGTVYAKQTTGGGTPYITGFGYNAAVNVTGTPNTAIGYRALSTGTTLTDNTAIGAYALYTNNTSNHCTAVGSQALGSATGFANTAIGSFAGSNITTGVRNIMIGYNTNPSSGTSTDEIAINPFGGYGQGTNTAYIGGTNGAYQGNNSAAWQVASDKRLKKNIVDNNIGLDKILSIQVRNFEYRTSDEVTELPQNRAIAISGTQLGVIAQELQEILPDCVKEQSTGVLSVNSENIMWHMINAIKELSAQVNELKTKVGA